MIVLVITLAMSLLETAGSVWSGSLTLLADAGHMLSDAGSIGLAMLAMWFAARPSQPHRTFGYQRAEILAALVNALLLVLVMVIVVRGAILRLHEPSPVRVQPMFALGALGLVANLASMRLLRGDSQDSLNVRGAYLEVMADMLAALAVLVAATLVWARGWLWADPVLSLALAVFILPRIAHLLRETTDVLMEAAPRGMDLPAVRQVMLGQQGVLAVHDLHVWTITSGLVCLSAHVVSGGGTDRDQLILSINRELRARFGVGHTTLQVEGEGQADFSGQRSEEACDPCAAPEMTSGGETADPAAGRPPHAAGPSR